MPELPDVEVFRRQIQAHGVGKRVDAVHVADKKMVDVSPMTLRRHLKGHELGKTHRHGKWIVVDVDGDDRALAMHFGMTGSVHLVERGEAPKDARLVLDLANDSKLAFTSKRRLGRVALVDDVDGLADEHDLGPDALGLKAQDLRRRLADKSGTVKGALMDQSTLAGIGNVYADEILFQARIHPKAKVPGLDDDDWKRLGRHTRDVLTRAIRYHADPHEMPDTWLTPHRREDKPDCPRCGTSLERAAVSGRTTIWCPKRV